MRHGTQPGKRTLTAMFGVKPVHVQTVLSASGQGGCTFDASFTKGAPLAPGADKYIVAWYPDQPVVSLADAHKASHRLFAAGVVEGKTHVGIRVVENSDVAKAVAMDIRGTTAALGCVRYRITGIPSTCATKAQVTQVIQPMNWHAEVYHIGWDHRSAANFCIGEG